MGARAYTAILYMHHADEADNILALSPHVIRDAVVLVEAYSDQMGFYETQQRMMCVLCLCFLPHQVTKDVFNSVFESGICRCGQPACLPI